MGEKALEAWAAAGRGVIAHRVQIDRTGWDHMLEFPIEPQLGPGGKPLAMDRWLAPMSCLVQVKATTAAKPSRPVSLKNCLRLAKNPQPAFFLILRFGQGTGPLAAYLVPLDETWVSRVLERVRAADSQGGSMRGQTLMITATESHRIQPDIESLERAVRAHVGPSMEEYAARKAGWNRRAGYEATTGNLTFHVPQDSLQGVSLPEYLVDLTLGMREPLAIERATITDVRFGIAARAPLVELPAGVLELVPRPVSNVEVRLRSGTARASHVMNLHAPAGLASIPPGLVKFRLTSKFMQLVVTASSLEFTITVPKPDVEARLRELYELASMVLLIEEGAEKHERMVFSVMLEGRALLQEELENPPRFQPELVALASIVRNAWKVAKHLEIQEQVNVALAPLLAQRGFISAFLWLIEPAAGRILVRFSSNQVIRDHGRQVCVPIGVRVSLGQFRGSVVSSLWGRLKRTDLGVGGEVGYELVRPRLKVERIFASVEEEQAPTLAETVHAIADAYDDSVTCVILPQFVMGGDAPE